jgi:hypothetical protein
VASIVAGLASSHAFTFVEPDGWDARRARNREGYKRRFGTDPPEHPRVAEETLEQNQVRYTRVAAGLSRLRDELARKRVDALLVIGDDQNENFTDENVPQFAIYTGAQLKAVAHGQDLGTYACHAQLAEKLLEHCVDAGFDLSFARRFPGAELKSHAHGPVLKVLTPEADVPIVPIFVNAIHPPAPSPARCYAFGQALRRAIESHASDERVAIYASGGLSHFTGGYPWEYYSGPYTYGSICEDFDRQLLDRMSAGSGSSLAALSSADLLNNGDIELRSWLVLLGAVGDIPATDLVYEPFYRGIMGMAVGYWDAEARLSDPSARRSAVGAGA